jgi:hypothetical protein
VGRARQPRAARRGCCPPRWLTRPGAAVLLADTNIWLAAADRCSDCHQECAAILREHRGGLAAPVPVIAEASWLILDRHRRAGRFPAAGHQRRPHPGRPHRRGLAALRPKLVRGRCPGVSRSPGCFAVFADQPVGDAPALDPDGEICGVAGRTPWEFLLRPLVRPVGVVVPRVLGQRLPRTGELQDRRHGLGLAGFAAARAGSRRQRRGTGLAVHHRGRRHGDEPALGRPARGGVPRRAAHPGCWKSGTLLAIDRARQVPGFEPAHSWRDHIEG